MIRIKVRRRVMLPSASLLLTLAAIASAAQRRPIAACLAAALASYACVRSWGWVEGLLVELALAMACASALVLVLAPRAHWTPWFALGSALLGLAACALGCWP